MPEPDAVIYLDMPVEISQKMMTGRYNGDENKKDIHEKNISYLNKCRVAAKHASAKLGWYLIDCSDGENPRSIESISSEIYEIIENLIDF